MFAKDFDLTNLFLSFVYTLANDAWVINPIVQ